MLPVLSIIHFIGFALAVGAATVKLILLATPGRDSSLMLAYLKVAKPISRTIIIGTVLLTLFGIGWLMVGYPVTRTLLVKLGLVVAIWVLGPIIDNRIEPRFQQAAAAAGTTVSPALLRTHKQLLAFEVVATLVFYAIIVIWIFR